MGKFITRTFALIGLLTVLGMAGIAVAVGVLWWQDRQWQARAASEDG